MPADKPSVDARELVDRFTHHPPHGDQAERYQEIRDAGAEFAAVLVRLCPESRELLRALDHLDETVMNANAAIARHT